MALMVRPLVKWAGGKTQLLHRLVEMIPPSFDSYYEPFLGGGALFFYLHRNGLVKNAILSDLNTDLIAMYSIVKHRVEELIDELASGCYRYEKNNYYDIRDEYNNSQEQNDPIVQAARFIYLNKTCYNGLYRVNRKGEFNVPFGKHANPVILDERNLRAASDAFSNVTLTSGDYETVLRPVKKADFIYLDPPYVPINSTSVFTSYTQEGFPYEEQKRLARVFTDLDKRGCFLLESNSNTKTIRELYSPFSKKVVSVSRFISSKKETRKGIPELLIFNYASSNKKR